MSDIIIPHNFIARDYQIPFLREVQRSIEGRSKVRFFYQVWHRRAGKDKCDIADVMPRRLMRDACLGKYVYPTSVMGRDNMWDGIDSNGFKYTDHIPRELRADQANETRMQIQIKNGTNTPSIFQVCGANNPDSLRGGNPKIFVLSEWAEHDPNTWNVIEPILRENDGIAIFNTTPKGNNHARALLEFAKNNPLWYVQTLTYKDTKIFTEDQYKQIVDDTVKRFEQEGRSAEEAIAYCEQEYMCSFDSPVIGSYYGAAIRKAEDEGRIRLVPYDQSLPVNTFWDLGMDDSTTIWFHQMAGGEHRFIDYYENNGEGLPHYAQKLQEKNYIYGRHYAPHDIAVRELGSGKSRLEIAKSLGIRFEIAPNLGIDDGINAGRTIFNQCYFDKDKCSRGLACLKNYKKDWDPKNQVFRSTAKHDWSSHGADGFRIFAVSYKRPSTLSQEAPNFGGVLPYFSGIR